jgi:hypothetical protein
MKVLNNVLAKIHNKQAIKLDLERKMECTITPKLFFEPYTVKLLP